ncbi:MAG: DUF1236 domain-containing protein [Rhodomicrobium sp.]
MSLAQAQSEHQGGGEKGGEAVEHAQPERGKEGGAEKQAPAAQERSKGEIRASPTKEKQPAEHREGERKTQDKQENQRQSNAARRPNIHISGVQKTKLHDAIGGSTAIHHYRASEIHFTVEVGTRVPDDIIFYDTPVQFIDIDPEFSGYKIVVLDDEILVIDPETREIVDVIPT